MAVFIAHSSEIEKNFDANGFAKVELLPGTYSGGITNYKCFLKAGKTYSPELYAGKTVLLIFGKGKAIFAMRKAPIIFASFPSMCRILISRPIPSTP